MAEPELPPGFKLDPTFKPGLNLPEGFTLDPTFKPETIGTGEDIAKSVGSKLLEGGVGVLGGIGDMREMMKSGSRWLGTHLGIPEEKIVGAQQKLGDVMKYAAPGLYFAPTTQQIQQTLDPKGRFQHTPQTLPGEAAGTIAGFLPGATTGGARTAGGLLADVTRYAVAPGVAAEIAGHTPFLDNPLGQMAAATLASHGTSRFITPRPHGPSGPPASSAAHQQSVDALESLNPPVPMSPGERFNDKVERIKESERRPERYLENRELSTLHSLRAVGNEIGNPNAFTNLDQGQGRVILRGEPGGYPGTVGRMLDIIGGNINNVVGQHNMMADAHLGQALDQFRRRYRYAPEAVSNEANRAADQLRDMLADSRQPGQPGFGTAGMLSGREAQNLRSDFNRRARGSENGQQSAMLHDFSHVIDDALDRSIMAQNPGNLGILQRNRAAYRAAQVIEDATSAKAGPASINHITPAALEAAAKKTYDPRWHARGQDPFWFAPHMAKVLVMDPSSETARRSKVLGIGADKIQHGLAATAAGLGGAYLGGAFHEPLSLQLLGEAAGPAAAAALGSMAITPAKNAILNATEGHRGNQLLANRPGTLSMPGLLTAIQAARQNGIPAYAQGGIVTKPTLGLVGENGPEAIIPLGQGAAGQSAQSGLMQPGQANSIEQLMQGLFQRLESSPQGAKLMHALQGAFPGGGKGWLGAPGGGKGGANPFQSMPTPPSAPTPPMSGPVRYSGPQVQAFAEGGIVDRPTVGLLGEAGPELVVPLDRLAQLSTAQMASPTLSETPGVQASQAALARPRLEFPTGGPTPAQVASMTHQADAPNPAAPIVRGLSGLFSAPDLVPMHEPGTKPEDYLRELYRNPEVRKKGIEQAGLFDFTGTTGGKGITAYHGSPHDFEKFDIGKIGTGEGAQAYGHGLYFAENEGVARDYKTRLSGNLGNTDTPHGAADRNFGNSPEEAIKNLEGQLRATRQAIEAMKKSGRGIPEVFEAKAKTYEDAIDLVKNGWRPGGRMYQVRLNADPEHFLDWDRPLSEQSAKVQEAVGNIIKGNDELRDFAPKMSGENVVTRLLPMHGIGRGGRSLDHEAIANTLRDAGIPGIRYLDQGSRAKGEGSRNYVMFDDKLIDIIKKYGLAGLIAGGAAHFSDRASAGNNQQQQRGFLQ